MRIRSLFRYAVLLAVSLLALPARAVVPEKDFQSTLNSLLQELRQSYASAQESDTLMVNNRAQREAFDRVLKLRLGGGLARDLRLPRAGAPERPVPDRRPFGPPSI